MHVRFEEVCCMWSLIRRAVGPWMTQDPARSVLVSSDTIETRAQQKRFSARGVSYYFVTRCPAVFGTMFPKPALMERYIIEKTRQCHSRACQLFTPWQCVYVYSSVLLGLDINRLLITGNRLYCLTAVSLNNCFSRPCSRYSRYVSACWTWHIICKHQKDVIKWTLYHPRKCIWVLRTNTELIT